MLGHWLIDYFAHRHGGRSWQIDGADVQGHNVRWCALPTIGNNWHNKHHAFPESARIGLLAHEFDPGWSVIRGLERVGLAWSIG